MISLPGVASLFGWVMLCAAYLVPSAWTLPKTRGFPYIEGRQFGVNFDNGVPSRQFGTNLNNPFPPGPVPNDVLLSAAGIHGLSVDHFPPQDDPDMTGKFPGLNSGQMPVNQMVQNVNPPKISIAEQASGGSCVPINTTVIKGNCANSFDVVIGRKCVNARTQKSSNCKNNEVCCFKIADKEVVESFDQVPCGMRRTPELAQRELQRIADEENFDQVPMKILGGLEAFQNEICWQAAIMVDGKYVCGGTVINSRNVMTAGHCLNDVEDIKQITIITGSKDLRKQGKCSETFAVMDVNFHDHYDPRSLTFDMAMLKLDRPITNTNCTCRVCLPEGNLAPEHSGRLPCIVTGFGTTEPGKTPNDVGLLNIANVNITVELPNNRQCTDRLHLSPSIPKNFLLDQSMICAIGEDPNKFADTCDLDGGSPLACRMNPDAPDVFTLVGLSSWGLPCGRNVMRDASGREVRIPTVYAHVRTAISWIDSKAKL